MDSNGSRAAIHSSYRYLSISAREAFEMVMAGRWDLPAFQRPFVWRPVQVSDLADSLWRGYPIGYLLIWDSRRDGQQGPAWIADGQQRLTALCLMFGERPPWWRRRASEQRNLQRRFDLRFDIEATAPPWFHCSFDRGLSDAGGRLVRVPEILAHDPDRADGQAALRTMAIELRRRGVCRTTDEEQVFAALHRVCRIQRLPLSATALGCGLEDAIEIFERLNARGTRFRRLLLDFAMRSLVSAAGAGMR
jgi:hypothetical protein